MAPNTTRSVPRGAARAVLDGLAEGVVALDAKGHIELVNPAAEEILEQSEGALRGKPVAAVRGIGPRLEALCARAIAEQRGVVDDAVPLPTLFGPQRVVEARAMPRITKGLSLEGTTVLLRERQDVLGVATDPANADTLFATIAAGVAHEVRNPLGGIRGAVQLLDADLPEGSPLREHARVALREVDRLASLVERLLDLGRPESGERAVLNLHAILDDVLATLLRDPIARAVTFERDYDPSLPPVVGDASALARMFHNLLRNATEATEGRGHVRVRTNIETGVRVRAKDSPSATEGREPGVVARVLVSDDGPGVPAEIVARLFLPFASGKPRGTGLGLALARKVAVDHGGWIALAPSRGKGAAFAVYLPTLSPERKERA